MENFFELEPLGEDDDIQIQAAIDSLSSTGGTIFLSSGTYVISTPILIKSNDIRIIGNGDSSIISFDGSEIACAIKNSDNTTRLRLKFSDFKIVSSSPGEGIGILLARFNTSTFSNLFIEDTNGGLYGSANSVFYNSFFNIYVDASGVDNYGFKFDQSANDNALYSCRVAYDMENGFILDGVSGILLSGCSAELCTIGLDIRASSSAIRIIGGWYENNITGIKIASGVESVTLQTKSSGNTTNVDDQGAVGLFAQILGDNTDPEFYFQDAKFSLTSINGYMGLNLGKTVRPNIVRFQIHQPSVPTAVDPIHTIALSSGSANSTNKHLGNFGWLSRDTSFTLPKLVAFIAAEATETYGSDVDTGSEIVFYNGADNGTNPVERLRIKKDGVIEIPGDKLRIKTTKTPASASATGTAGDICYDSNYIYVCIATNTWKRTAITTW